MFLLLEKFWPEFIFGAVILVFSIVLGITKHELKNARADLAQAQAQVIILSNNLNLQNAAVKVLGDATKDAEKRYQEAIKKAKVGIDVRNNKKNAVASIPATNSPICEVNMKSIADILKATR